jgi:hypothetical protein
VVIAIGMKNIKAIDILKGGNCIQTEAGNSAIRFAKVSPRQTETVGGGESKK